MRADARRRLGTAATRVSLQLQYGLSIGIAAHPCGRAPLRAALQSALPRIWLPCHNRHAPAAERSRGGFGGRRNGRLRNGELSGDETTIIVNAHQK